MENHFTVHFVRYVYLKSKLTKKVVHFLRKHNSNKCILIKECLDIETKKQDKNTEKNNNFCSECNI